MDTQPNTPETPEMLEAALLELMTKNTILEKAVVPAWKELDVMGIMAKGIRAGYAGEKHE